ncbi:MAG: DUF1559 domain-containing protein, partial [Thermoguttaceae bacterium]
DYGRTNYMQCSGDNGTKYQNYSTTNGVTRGCFGNHQWVGMDMITDGTSNTLLFSERAICIPTGYQNVIGGGIAVVADAFPKTDGGWDTLSVATGTLDLDKCKNFAVNGIYPTGTTTRNEPGNRFFTAWMANTYCNTILPPNSASCVARNDQADPMLVPPTSFHSGGVNAAFADGSVSFISNTINYSSGGTNPKAVWTGKSPFGVWGALGSKSGSESSAKP